MRSSTSSSEPAERIKAYAGWGLLFFLILLVMSEAFVFRNLHIYGYSPGFIGQIAELQASFRHTDGDSIEYAVFGDSEGMDGLRPELLAKDAGIARQRVFNFSISGGSAYDIAHIYSSYIDDLPHLRTAIVEVNEFQLNNTDAEKDIKFKYFAGLRDRFAVMNSSNYGELLLGWALKSYDMRTVWQMMLHKLWKKELRSEVPVHQDGLPPVAWSPKTDKTAAHAMEVADKWFKTYNLQGVRTGAFEAMIRDLRRRGIVVHIVQLPRTEYFEQAIASKYAPQQHAFQEKIRSIATEYGASYDVVPPGPLKLTDFRDTNHVLPSGAKYISAYTAQHWLTN